MSCDESPFRAEVMPMNGSAVVRLGGELDIATGPILRAAVDELVNPHLRALSLDLRDLAFVDVAGLRALLDAKRAVTEVDATFRLLSVCARTRRVIGIVRFDELEEALAPV